MCKLRPKANKSEKTQRQRETDTAELNHCGTKTKRERERAWERKMAASIYRSQPHDTTKGLFDDGDDLKRKPKCAALCKTGREGDKGQNKKEIRYRRKQVFRFPPPHRQKLSKEKEGRLLFNFIFLMHRFFFGRFSLYFYYLFISNPPSAFCHFLHTQIYPHKQ